jgi:acyl-CoA dehydrogenase
LPFDLGLTEEQQALKETLHDFSSSVLRPAARDSEAAKRTAVDISRQIHEIGVAAPVAEEFGGGGTFDAVTYCIAAEELAWGDAATAHHSLGSGLAAIVIGLAGSPEQQEAWLPAFAEAEPARTFVAIGEKVATGDLESLDTVLEAGQVRGEKYGVIDATDARFGIVVGRSSDGISAGIVEGGSYDVLRREDKLGLEASPTYVVRFDGSADLLTAGPELDKAVLWSKLAVGAMAVGQARASLEYAAQYATEREAFGKPIGAFQAIAFKVADMAIEVDAARMAVWRAAWQLDQGRATLADVSEAVGQALHTAILCGDDGVQILGGHGYIQDHPVEKWFRDAVTLSAFDAPDLAGDLMVSRSVFAGAGS